MAKGDNEGINHDHPVPIEKKRSRGFDNEISMSFAVAWVCALLHVGSVTGFMTTVLHAPFSPDQHTKALSSDEPFSTEFRDAYRIIHSAAKKATRLFSLPSDEDLFVDLFLENKKRKSSDISNAESSNTDDDLGNSKPLRRNVVPSSFTIDDGAGVPRQSLEPDEIVPLLMTALENVDVPVADAGLIAMWDFASDTTKFVFKNNRTEFIESCHETAEEFPTSFYGAAMKGKSWTIETEVNRVGGETGWIATQVTSTISSDGRMRRWQWELRKNRRPPCLGCWKVENIASSDRKGNFEPD